MFCFALFNAQLLVQNKGVRTKTYPNSIIISCENNTELSLSSPVPNCDTFRIQEECINNKHRLSRNKQNLKATDVERC